MLKIDVELKEVNIDAQMHELVKAIDANLNVVAKEVYVEAKKSTAFEDKTGNLRRSITKRKSRFENGGYIVFAKGSNRSKRLKGYHAHLVEKGHVMFLRGKPTGRRVPPHKFLEPALKKGMQMAIKLFRNNTQGR